MKGPEAQRASDFSTREVAAARTVIVELWSGLPSFREAMVLVGGWVPELLLPASHPPHTGSLDVDVLLDSSALTGARVQELLGELHTRHYRPTAKRFRFEKNIDLGDGGPSVVVGVDFLAPTGGVPDRDDTTQGGFRVQALLRAVGFDEKGE